MARGRVITPDFWTDANMVGVSSFARLFYIGMWNFAHCDLGHLDDDAMGLKLKILPADPVDPNELLAELMGRTRLARLRADNGKTFLVVPTFARYQKSDPRWKTRCPACALIDSGELTETPVSLVELSGTHLSSALRGENLREENLREPERREPPQATAKAEVFFDECWEHWPKKVERKAALEKFKAAGKMIDLDRLADAVTRFGDAYTATTERRYVPALGVWLTHERWTDELPTANASPAKVTAAQRNLDTVAHFAALDAKAISA